MDRPRALVVHPPLSVARDFIDYPYFSDLGAVQCAASLRAAGCDVALVDAFALDGSGLAWRPDGRARLGAPVDETLDACGGGFDVAVVAHTPFHRPPHRDDLLAAVCDGLRARAPDAAIVLADLYQSGQHYVDAPGARVLAAYPSCDAYVQYEGEATVAALALGARHTRPRGAYRGEEPPSLDALPPPAWDLVDLAAYARFHARVVAGLGRGAWAFPFDGRTLPMVTSRGCPFTCAHCSSNPGRTPGAPKTQRRLSPSLMRAQLESLARAHGATRVEVLDELVNVNERHWEAFLDAAEALDLRFDVPNGMRADYLSADHLRRMKGRVATVSVSAESGVQRVVTEVVGKRLDLAEIVRVAREAHAEGVPLMIHYIIGMPGETEAEVRATLDFAYDLFARDGAVAAVQYATPLPGTRLAEGRSLPVVADWGPHFQTAPSQPDALVAPDALVSLRADFDRRVAALRTDRAAPPAPPAPSAKPLREGRTAASPAMNAPPAIPPPRDLTIPDEGSTTARDVLSRSLRRLLGEWRATLRATPAAPDERDEVARYVALMDGVFAKSPALAASLARRPTVSTLVRCLRNALRSNDDARLRPLGLSRALRAQVGFELALAGQLPGGLRVTRPPRRLLSLAARAAVTVPDGAVTFRDGAIEGEGVRVDLAEEANLARPYVPVVGDMVLALEDNNPLAMHEAHPDKQGNAIDLGGRTADEWCDTLRRCLALVGEFLPTLRGEMDLFVQQLVPVGYDDHKHLSASYQEDVGTIYLTLHPNLMTMTEAVIHEFSHNKINALFELDELLENAYWPLYASPVRPDPRPLHGVVLAVHAFQPVARLYEAMIAAGHPWSRSPDFLRRYEQVKKVNRDGAAVVLGNGRPTAVGAGLFDEMRRWDEHFGA
jgi:HEXXH motif-containing protein